MTIDTVPPTEATDIAGTENTGTPKNPEKPKSWRDVWPVHPAAELFPEMSADELRVLADDIKRRGLSEHITLYKDPEHGLCVLDGRNRLDALELLGRQTFNAAGLPGAGSHTQNARQSFDPYAFVVTKNLCRRHLTAEDKRDAIAKLLKAKPEWSNRWVAAELKTDHHKVAEVRRSGEATGEIPPVERTTGKDGKERPARKFVEGAKTARSLRRAAQKMKEEPASPEPVIVTSSYDLSRLREAMTEVEVQAVAGNSTRLREALRRLQREAGVALEADTVIATPAVFQ